MSLNTFTSTRNSTVVSSGCVTVTGIVTVCSSSLPFHVKSLGVPSTLPSAFTFNPFVSVELITAFGLFLVTTAVSPLVYGWPSVAFSVGFVAVAVNFVTFLDSPGASSVSLIPSPSSSKSVLSGVPSLSVSRNTVTSTFNVTSSSPVWLTVTGIVTVCSSSLPFHVKSLGVPSTLPSAFTFNPFVSVELITAFGLFLVTTAVSPLVYGWPSVAFSVGFVAVAFRTSSTATSTSSLLPSGYTTSTVT